MAEITEWQERFGELVTDTGMGIASMTDKDLFKKMMRRYRTIAVGYLEWYLRRHGLAADHADTKAAARSIWGIVLRSMPAKLKLK